MNFYSDIAHRLYVWKTEIGDTKFEPFDYIEAKHSEAPYKGKVFYQNLIKAMPNHFGAEMRNDFFKEVLQYCKNRIDMYEQPYEQPDFIYSITGSPAWIEWQNDSKGHGVKLDAKGKGKAHALDIQNFATIAIDGGIKYPEQNFYDNKFIAAINATKNKAETIRYINHHYSNAKNKDKFLKKIDSLFERQRKYPIDEKLTPDVRTVLLEWYNVERVTISDIKEIDDVQEHGNTALSENHFCKRMPLSFAREHFKVLVYTDSNNKSKFLTDTQFEKFIQRAFLGNKKIPKQQINFTTRENQFVVKRFYEFYIEAVKEYYESQQSRDKFIKLLTDNFKNWEFEKVKSNFNKSVKRKW
jgi:hypothetical protein